jgi:NifU-like protein involved in Fe-S cluster formation
MNAPLYTTEILRLAASLPEPRRLGRVDGSASKRSPTCGSTVAVEVQRASDGTIAALSQQVSACAFGQASAALVAAGAMGRGVDEVRGAQQQLAAWLSGERAEPPDWPGFAALAPARSRKSRHGAILLPLQALAAALESRE